MVNWENFKGYDEDVRLINRLIIQIQSEIKFEKAKGLRGVSKEDIENIKDFRNFAKSINLFTEEHPILEDDINFLTVLKALKRVA